MTVRPIFCCISLLIFFLNSETLNHLLNSRIGFFVRLHVSWNVGKAILDVVHTCVIVHNSVFSHSRFSVLFMDTVRFPRQSTQLRYQPFSLFVLQSLIRWKRAKTGWLKSVCVGAHDRCGKRAPAIKTKGRTRQLFLFCFCCSVPIHQLTLYTREHEDWPDLTFDPSCSLPSKGR